MNSLLPSIECIWNVNLNGPQKRMKTEMKCQRKMKHDRTNNERQTIEMNLPDFQRWRKQAEAKNTWKIVNHRV